MKILEKAGLIERRIEGRQHHCSLSTSALKTAEDWINFHRKFWESRLDALEDLLTNKKSS
jgi:DNA-binding transcriptional ArsR family regulator